MTTTPIRPTNPMARAVTTASLVTEAAIAAADLGLEPDVISIWAALPHTPAEVVIQLPTQPDVDVLADAFDLRADNGKSSTYARKGHAVIAGDRVTVHVFSGRTL